MTELLEKGKINLNFSMLDLGAKVDALTNITTETFPTLLKAMAIKIRLDDGTLVERLALKLIRVWEF